MKILMVCLGNICRSPLAEGILKHKATQAGLNWQIDSAGTGSWHIGKLPDSRSIDVAHTHGIDITDQRARQFTAQDLNNYDIVYAMDSSNHINICNLATTTTQKEKVKLILNESTPNQNKAVPDPYWNDNGFEDVYQMLDEACEVIIERYG